MAEINEAINQLQGTLRDAVIARVVQLRNDISESIAEKGLRASGRTQQSLRVIEQGNIITLEGRAFFPALQYGSSRWTGATGVRCTFDAFRAIIRQWVADKALNLGQHKEHERAIGAITASIIRRGTKQRRTNAYTDVYDTLVAKAVKDIDELPASVASLAVDVVINQWKR